MIKLIVGGKGSGKTRLLTQTVNEDVRKTRGHLVYIDYRNKRRLQIDRNVRFVNTGEYNIENKDGFYGLICGIIASNYDIDIIYIDGLYETTKTELYDMEDFFKKIENLDLKYNINFVITISSEKEDLPEFLQKYMILE